jgi:lytic murein transglycosylase B
MIRNAGWQPGLRLPALARLRQLPRDARDTLFQIAVIGWTILPHLLHLPAWCSVMAGAVLLWRARLAWTAGTLPSRWLVSGLLAVATALTLWGESALWGKEAGVTMLVVLLTLKTLELRARRDALVVFFLGFFLVLTHFLYSQSLGTGVWMLLAVWGLLTALTLSHMPVGRPPLAQPAAVAARAALLGLPLMALLFLLFPRIGPLWGLPQDTAARTGLSGSMRLGGVAEVANDDSIALRLRFFGQLPAPEQMYFRGPVLSTYDGREWTRLVPTFPAALRPRADVELLGQPLRYEMTVEPSRLPLLPLLELTPDRPDAAPSVAGWLLTLRPDVQWQVDRPVAERVRVQAAAWLQHRHGPRQDVVGLRDLVQLPPGGNPRTLQWAADLRAQTAFVNADPRTLATAVLQHIRSGGYTYTMQPGSYGDNAIDDFWLDRKQGFCEHFAAAFVVVMRALDVPARIVTGYQGTDPAPQDGYWIVRQSNAHAWAEYWQPGEGWVRADPTAAVAPDRVRRGSSLAPQRGLVAGAIGALDPALAARMRAQWEAINNRWNQWVLNYSRKQQFDLLQSLGMSSPSWQDLATLLIGLLCSGALAGAAWAAWDRRRQDPWQRLQRRVQQRLAALGVSVLPHHAPRARAQQVRAALGAAGEGLAAQLDALDVLRYGQTAGQPGIAAAQRRWWRQFQATTTTASASASASAAVWVLASLAWAWPGAADAAGPSTKQHAKRHVQRHAEGPSARYAERPAVQAFADDVAARRGLDRDWVLHQLAAAQRLPQVQQLIMPPPAGTAKNWAAYRDRFVEPQRITAGLAFWRDNATWLAQAEARWGVPAEIVVAIVGVETFYGRITGGFRVVDALATLAFDFPSGRSDRSAFFRSELEEALVLAQREGLDPLRLKGSFAGAMGLPQFMPSSINRFAIDFDGNGHIDLVRSSADVVGSVAHYLAQHGWERGLPTHYAVAVPVDSSERALLLGPDIVPSFSAEQFSQRGARLDPAGQAHAGLLALVELQNGPQAPSYIAGTQNFYVVTRYNWSSYYALAVIELAQALRQAHQAR